MRYPDGSSELYDMARDPRQFTNLVTSPEHQRTRRNLDLQLATMLARCAELPRRDGPAALELDSSNH